MAGIDGRDNIQFNTFLIFAHFDKNGDAFDLDYLNLL